MQEIIARYGITALWHFTDEANFTSIDQQGGLLCYAELLRRGVAIPVPGGNDWSHDADARVGVHEYVHLAFLPNHPMLYIAKRDGRIPSPYWLKIDPSVLLLPGVYFCPEVANRAGATFLDSAQAVTGIDWEVLFTRTDWSNPATMQRRRAAEKSQVLVPNMIPLDKIIAVHNG